MTWMKELFGTDKPVIGLLHLLAMPTDPKYDREGGMNKVLERARREVRALQDGGIDGILMCNEFSIPYIRHVEPVTVGAMAYIAGALSAEIRVPFGVHAAHDPASTMDLAGAVGADFVRGSFSGINGGDYGLMNFEPGELRRRQVHVGAEKARVFHSLVPEGGRPMVDRDYRDMAVTNDFNLAPDVFMVAALTAGREPSLSLIRDIKSVTKTPVFCNNGVTPQTVKQILSVADGCMVGTGIKKDGIFTNEVDEERVAALMKNAKEARLG